MIGRADRDARFADWLNENNVVNMVDDARRTRYAFARTIDGIASSGSEDGGCRAVYDGATWAPQMTPATEAAWCSERAEELIDEAIELQARAKQLLAVTPPAHTSPNPATTDPDTRSTL